MLEFYIPLHEDLKPLCADYTCPIIKTNPSLRTLPLGTHVGQDSGGGRLQRAASHLVVGEDESNWSAELSAGPLIIMSNSQACSGFERRTGIKMANAGHLMVPFHRHEQKQVWILGNLQCWPWLHSEGNIHHTLHFSPPTSNRQSRHPSKHEHPLTSLALASSQRLALEKPRLFGRYLAWRRAIFIPINMEPQQGPYRENSDKT